MSYVHLPMKIITLLAMLLVSLSAFSQGFEVNPPPETYRGKIGETFKIPFRIRNTSEKAIVMVIRKVNEQIGTTQKNYFCPDQSCLDELTQDFLVRIEPGQSSNLQIGIESGLVSGPGTIHYLVYNRLFPNQSQEVEINFHVDEVSDRTNLYQSKSLIIKDFYPNPVIDHASIEYSVTSDRSEAKVQIRNLLGNIVAEYLLDPREQVLRFKTDELTAGIYFYTVVLNNESVMTRKLVVKK